jgi:hypothetical protein
LPWDTFAAKSWNEAQELLIPAERRSHLSFHSHSHLKTYGGKET